MREVLMEQFFGRILMDLKFLVQQFLGSIIRQSFECYCVILKAHCGNEIFESKKF